MATSWTWLSRSPALVMRMKRAFSWNSGIVCAPTLPHGGAQASGELMHDRSRRTA
jgi:hypothetical protein